MVPRTWTQQRILDQGVAGYSDLAVDGEKNIYVLYEEGAIKGSETTQLAHHPGKVPDRLADEGG